ncbi:hypothetical protein BJ085DRAFT_10771, partial [Dimargaris cristalligena]
LKLHRGAVDQNSLTSLPPDEVFQRVKQIIFDMGLEVYKESDYKIKCIRPSSKAIPPASGSPAGPQTVSDNGSPAPVYGELYIDAAGEVRLTVDICKLKNLPHLLTVRVRRQRGNIWSYKFLY